MVLKEFSLYLKIILQDISAAEARVINTSQPALELLYTPLERILLRALTFMYDEETNIILWAAQILISQKYF